MCVSAAPADFTGTTLYVGELEHPTHGYIHTIGYQNTAQNLADRPNAMILHVPAIVLTKDNLIDTREAHSIFKDMVNALRPVSRGGSKGLLSIERSAYEIFEFDVYTIVIAHDPMSIPQALKQVHFDRRPSVSPKLCEFYKMAYPGYKIVLCCFNNRDAKLAAPMFWWYSPIEKDYFRAPAIDCHTGGVPDVHERVTTDHWFILGSDRMNGRGASVYYTDDLPEDINVFLPKQIVGKHFSSLERNGDFGSPVEAVRNASLDLVRRIRPPQFS